MRREIYWGSLVGVVLTAGIAGCTDRRAAYTTPTTVIVEEQEPRPEVRPRHTQRTKRFELAYPTGDRETSTLLVEKFVPSQVLVGQRYVYQIRVTNLTDAPLANVVIDERARGFEIQQEGKPAPGVTMREPGRWVIATLPPRASETIRVSAMARAQGTRTSCLTVDYQPALCSAVAVVEPELELIKTAPRTAYTCDQAAFEYSVTNTGTGTARGVTIFEELPEGLTTADGQRVVEIEVGDLRAGETARRRVALRAEGPGTFQSRAIARSETDEASSELTATTLVQPELEIQITGPEWQYAGEEVTYGITVTNTSDVPARQTMLQIRPSARQAAQGVERDRSLGTLGPGESRTVNVTLRGEDEAEELRLSAAARSTCAPLVADRIVTDLRHVASLRIGTVDTADPIRVGERTTYEVSVTNQGRVAIEDVDVVAIVPPEMTVVDVRGPTEARLDGNRLVLGPVAMKAGATARWSVEVRADRPGTVRFRTEVDSAFLDRPVPDVEPTRIIPRQPQQPLQPLRDDQG
jgi:uncharacterized repeat protein (TIGR01451 family)